jgi:hypothetical protein
MNSLKLICKSYEPATSEPRLDGREIFVNDSLGASAVQFELMRWAIYEDIQHPQGSGAQALEEIRKIESGEAQKIEADGNAWVAHITKERVWFEGLYGQGEGGEVSLAQYKLAVQTYVQFLSDPEQKCIEVAFPAE